MQLAMETLVRSVSYDTLVAEVPESRQEINEKFPDTASYQTCLKISYILYRGYLYSSELTGRLRGIQTPSSHGRCVAAPILPSWLVKRAEKSADL